jgi:tetratricopeptide (TPR) repeat protein
MKSKRLIFSLSSIALLNTIYYFYPKTALAEAEIDIQKAADKACAFMSGRQRLDPEILQLLEKVTLGVDVGNYNQIAIDLDKQLLKQCPKAYITFQQRNIINNPLVKNNLLQSINPLANPSGNSSTIPSGNPIPNSLGNPSTIPSGNSSVNPSENPVAIPSLNPSDLSSLNSGDISALSPSTNQPDRTKVNSSSQTSNQQEMAKYDEAIRQNPKDVKFYLARGKARYDRKNYQEALADYTEAIRLEPKNPIGYANRGLAKNYLGDKQGTIADLQIAAKLFEANGDRDNHQKVLKLLQQIK